MFSSPQALVPGLSPLFGALYARPSQGSTVSPALLLEIAETFSPRFEQHRADLVSVDLRGLDRLFGTPQLVGEEMRRVAASRGVQLHVGIATTRTVATVMAIAQPGLSVVPAGGEAAALAPLSLVLLEQIDAYRPSDRVTPTPVSATVAGMVATIKTWGLRTLGELVALPAADLSARTGRMGLFWQQIARGGDARPLVPTRADERFEGTLELEWPIEGLEPLSFVLTRLLEPLSTRLERADRGAAALQVSLRLIDRTVYARRLEIPAPMRDVRALRTLALLDLEAHPPGTGIDSVTVTIDPTPGRILQHTLFTRPHPTPEQLSTLLARLGALMGEGRIGAAVPVDSHRPGAFAMKPFALDHTAGVGRRSSVAGRQKSIVDSPEPGVRSALRRYRQPVAARVAVADGRPVRVTTDRPNWGGGAVTTAVGPWRTSGEWWEGEAFVSRMSVLSSRPSGVDAGAWDRDEWDVALADGGMYRIFQNRVTSQWFVDAVMD